MEFRRKIGKHLEAYDSKSEFATLTHFEWAVHGQDLVVIRVCNAVARISPSEKGTEHMCEPEVAAFADDQDGHAMWHGLAAKGRRSISTPAGFPLRSIGASENFAFTIRSQNGGFV